MKYVHIVAALLAALSLAMCMSCSPDIEEEEEEVVEVYEEEVPEPHWADGTVVIETGRHRSGKGMLDTLLGKRNFWARSSARVSIARIGSLPRAKKTVEVSVITFEEAGIEEPLTLDEVRQVYKELGYRPLTLEEAVELRIQFEDQPESGKMSNFCVLLTNEAIRIICEPPWKLIFFLSRNVGWGDKHGEGYTINVLRVEDETGPFKFYPNGHWENGHHDANATVFACVKVR